MEDQLEDQLQKKPNKAIRAQIKKQYSKPVYFSLKIRDGISFYKIMNETELEAEKKDLTPQEEKSS
ncbi:hypothetical protein GO491_04060 [Flavobacteriaceae bacterium Ap0902]|nr:hypothetical protein [Flavobacteriaceae bacterium Ap0902]